MQVDMIKIHIRKIGCRMIFRVEGSELWHWSEREAREHHRVYVQSSPE